jgi:predicted outer membrane protein
LAGWLASVVFVAAASPHQNLSQTDKTFLASAAVLTNYEIKAAAIAVREAPSDSDRSDAGFLILEDQKVVDDVRAIAERDDRFRLPTSVDPAHARLLARLQSRRVAFASEYARQMAASHLAMQALYRNYLHRDDADRRVKAVISAAMPTVAIHLQLAKALAER